MEFITKEVTNVPEVTSNDAIPQSFKKQWLAAEIHKI